MTTIAHLTDLHLIEDDHRLRTNGARARLSFLSFGRPLDARARRERFTRALQEAWSFAPEHLLLTGDLTEDGTEPQFEVLAELLGAGPFPAHAVTLIPGNHDAYASGDAWEKAFRGPLSAYAPTSALGEIIALRDADVVPLSTAMQQSVARSAGFIEDAAVARLVDIAETSRRSARPLIAALHHPPIACPIPLVNWVDGLQGAGRLTAVMSRFSHLYAVHGHTHKRTDRAAVRGDEARIFSAEAVVESEAPLRLYEASPRGLAPVPEADASRGAAPFAFAPA